MITTIKKCQNCNLYKNQKPLLDKIKISKVMWVGLSAKRVDNVQSSYPLKHDTNSGMIIKEIENKRPNISFYKTNLVKCLPLNNNDKLRYPNLEEMNSCINNLLVEISLVNPKIIFLLGNKVYEYVTKYLKENKIMLNCKIIKIKHPSYIFTYRRKNIENYINDVVEQIDKYTK